MENNAYYISNGGCDYNAIDDIAVPVNDGIQFSYDMDRNEYAFKTEYSLCIMELYSITGQLIYQRVLRKDETWKIGNDNVPIRGFYILKATVSDKVYSYKLCIY